MVEGTIVYSGSKDAFDTSITILSSLGGDQQLVSTAVGGAPTFDKAIYAFTMPPCSHSSMALQFAMLRDSQLKPMSNKSRHTDPRLSSASER